MKQIGVVRFLGTNCDYDVFNYIEAKGFKAKWIWYEDQFNWRDFEAVILAGGFSYGDYLRSGALASRSTAMLSLKNGAAAGLPVLGICNGFQILCESGLLPGALVKNENQMFIDKWVELKIENSPNYFAKTIAPKSQISLPVAHGDGRYYAPVEELQRIEGEGLVWLRYQSDINGSLNSIAGVLNKNKNVAGLMPHPERAIADWMGGVAGWDFL